MSLSAKEAFSKLPEKLHNFFIKHPPRPFAQYSEKPSIITDPNRNPFLPNKNPETNRWHEPRFSLRRQADLYKMAYKFGIAELLPPMRRKFFAEKYNDKNWMRGVLNPKKAAWERALPEKMEARKEAIAKMDETIMAARPLYKRLLKKRQSRQPKWF